MARTRLTVAYTPDSDDAFYYDAIEQGILTLPKYRFAFRRKPMARLNRAAIESRFAVTAISSVVYPMIADEYAILSVGTSVGRGYGPVLVSRESKSIADLDGARVGVPGIPTTGWFLLKQLCPTAVTVKMPFDRIAQSVVDGKLDAGVMIHEELLFYPQMGLQKVVDLGAEWCERHSLPLPVGLNVIRRDLGPELMGQICALIARSLRTARENPESAIARVSKFGRGREGGVTEQFVRMFANDDSQEMPADVRNALPVVFQQVVNLGLASHVPPIDIVEPAKKSLVRVRIKTPHDQPCNKELTK